MGKFVQDSQIDLKINEVSVTPSFAKFQPYPTPWIWINFCNNANMSDTNPRGYYGPYHHFYSNNQPGLFANHIAEALNKILPHMPTTKVVMLHLVQGLQASHPVANNSMPFFPKDNYPFLTEVMRILKATFPKLAWAGWCGNSTMINAGSQDNPNFLTFEETSFPFAVKAFDNARKMGFNYMGLDALSRPVKQGGLEMVQKYLEYLVTHSKVKFLGETVVNDQKLQELAPFVYTVNSRTLFAGNPDVNDRPTVDELPTHKGESSRVIGSQIIPMMFNGPGETWTMEEFDKLKAYCLERRLPYIAHYKTVDYLFNKGST